MWASITAVDKRDRCSATGSGYISTLTSNASEADRTTDNTAVETMIILQYTVEEIGWEETNSVPCKDTSRAVYLHALPLRMLLNTIMEYMTTVLQLRSQAYLPPEGIVFIEVSIKVHSSRDKRSVQGAFANMRPGKTLIWTHA
jgi:hypothetical protein